MSSPSPGDMITFNVIHNDGCIRVRIDGQYAILNVDGVNDVGIVIRALGKAVARGAVRGTLFTGEVVNDQIARMHEWRAQSGTTWLGGRVTRLMDGIDGPQFRIDWDSLPIITQ